MSMGGGFYGDVGWKVRRNQTCARCENNANPRLFGENDPYFCLMGIFLKKTIMCFWTMNLNFVKNHNLA